MKKWIEIGVVVQFWVNLSALLGWLEEGICYFDGILFQ